VFGVFDVVAEFEEAGIAVEVGVLPEVGAGCEGAGGVLAIWGVWEERAAYEAKSTLCVTFSSRNIDFKSVTSSALPVLRTESTCSMTSWRSVLQLAGMYSVSGTKYSHWVRIISGAHI
jgi:hypothetical protein